MRCRSCGAEAATGAMFCSQCGAKLAAVDSTSHTASGLFSPAGDAAPSVSNNASPNDAVPNPSAGNDVEKELWRGGFSPKAMLPLWLASVFLSTVLLAIGCLWVRTVSHWMILLAVIILPWLYCLAVLAYRHMGIHYRLTSQQFIHETGVLRRVNNRIETLDMADIVFTQTLLQRLAGVGDIRILSSDRSDPDLVLHGIDNVAQVAEIFNNARREERRHRGVHIEQI